MYWGIRCEKATSYLKDRGYKNVFHLEGGILKYFEDVSDEENLWNGECFVFDNRVSLKKDLKPGEYSMCHACRMPLAQKDLESKNIHRACTAQNALGHTLKNKLNDLKTDKDKWNYQTSEKHLGGSNKAGWLNHYNLINGFPCYIVSDAVLML